MRKNLACKVSGYCIAFIVFYLFFSHPAMVQWTTSGANVYNSNTGFFGAGTGAVTTSAAKLEDPPFAKAK